MEESKQKLIYPDFRDRCNFQTTLEISNQLTDAESKSFLSLNNTYQNTVKNLNRLMLIILESHYMDSNFY